MDRTRWLALPLSALLLAACGSSGGDKLSKSDLIAKADKALQPPRKGDLGQAQETTGKAAKLAQDAAGKLKDLTPPDSVKADYNTFTTSVSTQADQVNALADALKKKDTAKIKSIFSEFQQGASKVRASAQKVGLKKCGGSS